MKAWLVGLSLAGLLATNVATQTLADDNRQLAARGRRLQTAHDDLAWRHAQASHTRQSHRAASVNRRLAKGVARNTAAFPAESVPYVGIGVTLSVTALDIHDACPTMTEITDLLKLLNQGDERADCCGARLPTMAQVVERLKAAWRSSMAQVAADARDVPAARAERGTVALASLINADRQRLLAELTGQTKNRLSSNKACVALLAGDA